MKTVKLEGVATITSKGFNFDSGLPGNEKVVEKQFSMRGKMRVRQNGCVEFVKNEAAALPPHLDVVVHGVNYLVRRSTRNYIIQVKVPVVENRKDSEDTITNLIPKLLGEITLDRQELLGGALS